MAVLVSHNHQPLAASSLAVYFLHLIIVSNKQKFCSYFDFLIFPIALEKALKQVILIPSVCFNLIPLHVAM